MHVGTGCCGYEAVFGHYLAYLFLGVLLETEVAVGEHAYEEEVVVHYRYAADAVLLHNLERITNGGIGLEGDGVEDEAVLRAFYFAYLLCLALYTHVFMQYAYTAFAREGDSQWRFGNGIHSSRYHWYVDAYVFCELRGNVDFSGEYFGVSRHEEDVIECEAFAVELRFCCHVQR